jgi:hypothetical protein
MALFPDDDANRASGSRVPFFSIVSLLIVVAAGALWWLTGESRVVPPRPRPDAEARAPAPRPSPPASAGRATRARPTAPAPTPRVEPTAPEPVPATPAARGVLRVHSDVAGASVFLDRNFLGTTPLEKTGLAPGSHRLNVSAEGYDGVAQAVEIGDEPAEVTVRFKEVRLDVSILVVHKHRMGSCEGRLVATVRGLHYDTTHRDDRFSAPFTRVEGFDVDYLQKTLRVRVAGGKTYNFTDPGGNADALFVFHRDVNKARTRLAAQ